MFDLLGRCGRQPSPEAEDAARNQNIGDERQIALDIGLAGRRAPGHDDLGFCRQEHLGAVEPGAQIRQFLGELALALCPTAATREMQKRRYGRKEGEADQERNPCDLTVFRHSVDRETPNVGRRPARRYRTRDGTDGCRSRCGLGRRGFSRSRQRCDDPGVSSARCAVDRRPDDFRACPRRACCERAVEPTTPSLRRLSPHQALPPVHVPCPLRPCGAGPLRSRRRTLGGLRQEPSESLKHSLSRLAFEGRSSCRPIWLDGCGANVTAPVAEFKKRAGRWSRPAFLRMFGSVPPDADRLQYRYWSDLKGPEGGSPRYVA